MDHAVSGTAVQVQQDCAVVGEGTVCAVVTLGSWLVLPHGTAYSCCSLPVRGGCSSPSGVVVTRPDVKEAQPVWAGE